MPGDFHRIGIRIPPTATEREALEVAYDLLATGARRVGETFTEPDDDWRPLWVLLTDTQATIVTPGDDVDKHAATDYVGRLARRWGAVAVGHLHSSWMVTFEDVDAERMAEIQRYMRERHGSTEGLPERREVLLIAAYSATTARQWHAAIHRDDTQPPTLGTFDLMLDTTHDDVDLSGAMVDPLRDALRKVG